MSQSLSWIDPSAFSAALNRAGFDPSTSASSRRSPIWLPGTRLGSAPRANNTATATPAMTSASGLSEAQPAPSLPAKAERDSVPGKPPNGNGGSLAGPQQHEAPKHPPLKLESDRLDRRLEAYMAWVETCTACKGLFIVDEEGLVLMERDSDPNLVALSAYFLNLKDRIPDSLGTRSEGSIAIDLDDERVLHVVQADTRLGPHALGFTVGSPLHRNLTQSFQDSLSSVFAAVG